MRSVALDEHVGLGNKIIQRCETRLCPGVELDRPLAVVDGPEMGRLALVVGDGA